MAYSMDLRERVVSAVQAGATVTQVARRFDVSRPAVRDWRDRAQHGELMTGVAGPKGPTKLTKANDAMMCEQVAARPGITARDHGQGMDCHAQCVGDDRDGVSTFDPIGFAFEKKTLPPGGRIGTESPGWS